jgi:probable O-glycosylation ligase (exosortase A-associated)
VRDLVLTAVILGSVPFILRNPFVGLLMWVWVGIMNPHRLAWGFAYDMPFAQVIAISTLVSILINNKKVYRFPADRVSILLVVFVLWLGVSPLFSFHPDQEFAMWLKAIKILFMVLIGLLLVGTREQLYKLTWVLALSVGFFGVKGGVFTIATGGGYRVWGPSGSFIEDNNAMALATIMTVPLFRYLQLQAKNAWVRRGSLLALLLCVVSALGSYSRGALLAIVAMGAFLFMKTRNKGLIAVVMLLGGPIAFVLMPGQWFDRMSTIETYDKDASALGRINAWHTAWNLAVDRFPIGGGFAMYEPDVFARYAPNPRDLHAAHSIYFQILGEHGFVGLLLFLGIFGFTWMNGSWIVRKAKERADLEWARDLAAMCQVSLIGYAVGGAFLSLTYFDLPYYLVVILLVLRRIVSAELAAGKDKVEVPAPGVVAPSLRRRP